MTFRVDVVSIFPEYLAPLELSLIGKARERGTLDLRTHDLREVTTDRHRTVDDTPFGGGAGMVMRPDVWDRAIAASGEDHDGDTVVIVPTPSGRPFTQQVAHELADLDAGTRLVFACGRYEGIDARLAQGLAARGTRVIELSIGDYVLNGGEVATLVILEAVVRLLPGVLGNAESLAEESFAGDGLLEYPVYTKPPEWDAHEVPPILRSGDHGAIARWRREQSLRRTARRRPELLAAVEQGALTVSERAVLAEEGVHPGGAGSLVGPFTVRTGRAGEGALLADLAAATFALACPDDAVMGSVRSHIRDHLSASTFERALADAERDVLLVLDGVSGTVVGYAVVVAGTQEEIAPSRDDEEHLVEISKCYVLPRVSGAGAAGVLMHAALDAARARGAATAWLGVNAANARARRFYERQGFTVAGSRRYVVGAQTHEDHLMRCELEGRGVRVAD